MVNARPARRDLTRRAGRRVSPPSLRPTIIPSMKKPIILALAALAALVFAVPAARAQSLDQAVALYNENQLEEALPLFQAVVQARPADADARAWLAETLRRLGELDAAAATAREALRIDSCHAFAHGVLGDTYFPLASTWPGTDADSAWAHIGRAVECDPDDGNLWLSYWSHAEGRLDSAAVLRATRAVAATGFIPPPVMALGRWLLETAPPNAVLMMAGDWDYFPARVAQVVEGVRPDVQVVSTPWLEVPAYAVPASERVGVPAPPEVVAEDWDVLFPEADTVMLPSVVGRRVVDAWLDARLAGRLARPVTVAVSASPYQWGERSDVWWQPAGAHFAAIRSAGAAMVDTAGLRRALEAVDPAALAGPHVHASDRSPIRRSVQGTMVGYYVYPTVIYGEALTEGGRLPEARAVLARLRAIAAATPLPEWHLGEIDRLATVIRLAEDGG